MLDVWFARGARALMASVCCAACASGASSSASANAGGTVPPANSDEQQLLDRMSTLPVSASTRVGNTTVVAGPSYSAASGRTCRHVELSSPSAGPTPRLACTEGEQWFFVPDVFITPADPEP